MGWKRVKDDNDIEKWSEGMIVVGTLVEKRENKFGPLVVISTEEGPKTYGCPAVLERKLAKVETGTLVRIKCTGKVEGESGQSYWTFVVDVADSDVTTNESVAAKVAAPVDAADSDIPF